MANRAPLPVTMRRGDWTQQELCELDRIRVRCSPNSSFSAATQMRAIPGASFTTASVMRSSYNIARIDCRYVMARASRAKLFTVSSLSAAINAALDELHRVGR